jgi:hypothetical protein
MKNYNEKLKFFFLFISVLIMSLVLSSQVDAGYNLSPGPYSLENLGPMLSSSTQEGRYVTILSNGEKHLFVFYDNTGGNSQLVDVNMNSESATLVDLPGNGRTNMPGALLGNDKFYGALLDGSMNPNAPLIEYNPATRTSRQAGIISDKGLQSVVRGDDGDLYVGSSVKGVIGHYDPNSDLYEDFGKMDEASTSGYIMVYTIGSDGRYIYAGMRDNDGSANWYLGVYDRVAREKHIYFKNDGLGGDLGGDVNKLVSGDWFYETYNSKRPADQYKLCFLLQNGSPSQVPCSYPRQNVQRYDVNKVYDNETFATKFNYEFNFDFIYPDNLNNSANYSWKLTSDESWKSVIASGFRMTPVRIRRFIEGNNSKMLATNDMYGPVMEYDIASNTTRSLGRPGVSVYDLLKKNDDLYISGYPTITERYDLSKPWTLSAGAGQDIWDTDINPHEIAAFAKYHYFSAVGYDGKIYIGFKHLRESVEGSGIGWYDPATGQTGKISVVSPENVADLKPVLNGTKMVFTTVGEKMYVFDVATKQIEREITPIQGASLRKVIEVSPGIVIGAQGTKLYKVDIRTGEVLFTKDLPGSAYGSETYSWDARLDSSPDGFVWLFCGNSLYRINPTDGSMQKIVDTTWGRIRFVGTDLYLYGDTSLRRVKNILSISHDQADLNSDNLINFTDFNFLKTDFLKLAANLANPRSDIDGDGQATVKDVGILMSVWKP